MDSVIRLRSTVQVHLPERLLLSVPLRGIIELVGFISLNIVYLVHTSHNRTYLPNIFLYPTLTVQLSES